jgi:hypothetical protein
VPRLRRGLHAEGPCLNAYYTFYTQPLFTRYVYTITPHAQILVHTALHAINTRKFLFIRVSANPFLASVPVIRVVPRGPQDLRRLTGIILVIIKIPTPEYNRGLWPAAIIRPLHNRYTRTDTCVRLGMAVTYDRYKFRTVSITKRLRNGRFASETATWIQKW